MIPAPRTGEGAGRPAPSASSLSTVHSDYDRRAEIKVRALCALALTAPSAHLLGLNISRHDTATAHLRLAIALDGPGTAPLNRWWISCPGNPACATCTGASTVNPTPGCASPSRQGGPSIHTATEPDIILPALAAAVPLKDAEVGSAVAVLKALAGSIRLRLLQALDHRELSVGELTEQVGARYAARCVSPHRDCAPGLRGFCSAHPSPFSS